MKESSEYYRRICLSNGRFNPRKSKYKIPEKLSISREKVTKISDSTGWVKKKWDLKKLQIALTHSILKLKSNVIPLNQMSQSGEKHAQD